MKTPFRILFALLAASPVAIAEVPQIINYQGRVAVNGTNFDGTGQFRFALVGGGGSPVFWSNGASTVSLGVSKGLFSVLLGDTNLAGMTEAVPSAVFTNTDVRLRVWFDGGAGLQLLAPDPRIGAVGYAMTAGRAETAGSLPPGSDITGARLNIGSGHTLAGFLATIGGGTNNTASGLHCTVGGGERNTASGSFATVGGGSFNSASNMFATVAGGRVNTADGYAATVGGGLANSARTNHATVAGGFSNTASSNSATVGGGSFNTASGSFATLAGGYINTASGYASTVAGGQQNTASGSFAIVAGGQQNTASGFLATVPGGYLNVASGTNSFAAGNRAKAQHDGAFVWGDSYEADIASTTNNQFTARCSGGVRLFSNTNATTGVELFAGGGSWAVISDRNAKENFNPVDCGAVLEKIAAIPVTTWNLKSQDPAIRHIGPMAQDFSAAFAVGEDDRHINTSDADGVAFAAIKGLYELVREKDAEIARLKARDAETRARLSELEKTLQRASQQMEQPRPTPTPICNARTPGGI